MVSLRTVLRLGLCSVFLVFLVSTLPACQQKEAPGSHKGKIQLTMTFVAPADKEAEGDRLFASHAKFVEETHFSEGDKALILYNLSKGPDLAYTTDYGNEKTKSDTIFYVLTQIYETSAGLTDNLARVHEDWKDMDAFIQWGARDCKTSRTNTTIVHSIQ